MKRSKLALAMSLIMILSLLVPTAHATSAQDISVAEGDSSLLRFSRIDTLSLDFSISSSGKSTSYGSVKLSNSTDTVELTLDLQQSSGSSWSTIKTWSTSGSNKVTLEKDWYVASGYNYRLAVTANVYNSSGSLVEIAVAYSAIVSY
jgi:hypothetical protein